MFSRVSVELIVLVAIITSAVSAASDESWLGPEFSVLQKVYDDCLEKDDFTGCLKGKALGALNKAIEQVRLSSQSIQKKTKNKKQNIHTDTHTPTHKYNTYIFTWLH